MRKKKKKLNIIVALILAASLMLMDLPISSIRYAYAEDTDNDGLTDDEETNPQIAEQFRTNPNNKDSDNDGIWDGVDELPNDRSNAQGIAYYDNLDPQDLANGVNVLFVNPFSSNWGNPQTNAEIRAKALDPATPAPSLQVLNNVLAPGDTVLLRGGIHYLHYYLPTLNTTSESPLTIKSYPGEEAILTDMVIARGWEFDQIINNNPVYRKRFVKNYTAMMCNTTALTGYSGSTWHISLNDNERPLVAGTYTTKGPQEHGYISADPNKQPDDMTTTMYVSLPTGANPDNSIIRVGQKPLLTFSHNTSYPDSHYRLEDITFMYTDEAINIGYATILVNNCRFKNLSGQGIVTGASTDPTKNSTEIANCYFENIGSTKWDHGIYAWGNDALIHHNQFYDISGGSIHLYKSSGPTNGNIVYNNLIGPAKSLVYQDDGKYGIYDWGNNTIYNNIIYGLHFAGISFEYDGGRCFDNTIVGAKRGLYFTEHENGTGIWATNKIIKNNIVAVSGGEQSYCVYALRDRSNVLDHNLYYSLAGSYKFYVFDASRTYMLSDFGDYQDLMLQRSQEQNSLFVDAKFANADTDDFHLTADSPAIDAGTAEDASEIVALDFDGILRPQGTAYDIGAYEYILYGDVSGEGEITAYDAALAARIAVGLPHSDIKIPAAAEVSGDGKVTAYDAALIARRAVGLIAKFPVE